MSCKSLLYMVGMFVFVPVWIGLLWTDFLKIRECASQLLHAWVLGFATMLATAQLVLVPFVMMQKTLTQALLLWRILLQILAVLSFVIWLGRRAGAAETVADAAAGTEDGAGVQKKERGKAGTWTASWTSCCGRPETGISSCSTTAIPPASRRPWRSWTGCSPGGCGSSPWRSCSPSRGCSLPAEPCTAVCGENKKRLLSKMTMDAGARGAYNRARFQKEQTP